MVSVLKNYYELFGIAVDADRDDIKRAYRQLARQYHPDVRPNDPKAAEQFKQINEAYQTLINVERRARYDTELRHQQQATQPASASIPKADSVAQHDPSVASAKVTYSKPQKPENTNAFVLYMFVGLLITLMIIIFQGILVSIIENDTSSQRRAPNLATQRADVVTSTSTPSGPANRLQFIESLESDAFIDATAQCRVFVRGGQHTCDGISAIQFVIPLQSEQGVMQIDLADYSRVVLRVTLRGEPNNWTLNVGGSPKNDGTNDISSNPNDAQASLFGRDLLIYSNSQNNHDQLARITDVLPPTDGVITLDFRHQQIAWHTDSLSQQYESRYWLNMVTDDGGMLYIGLNRAIVEPTTRTGTGLDTVTIWLFP